jgi:hypothetical protein
MRQRAAKERRPCCRSNVQCGPYPDGIDVEVLSILLDAGDMIIKKSAAMIGEDDAVRVRRLG